MPARSKPRKSAASREPKTRATGASVPAFLARATSGERLSDAKSIVKMIESATGEKAVMWGDAIVGCGTYTIRYADGREAPWPLVAFSPRASSFVFYMAWRKHPDLVRKIGKSKTAGGCLHIKALKDIDEAALDRLMSAAARSRKGDSPV